VSDWWGKGGKGGLLYSSRRLGKCEKGNILKGGTDALVGKNTREKESETMLN